MDNVNKASKDISTLLNCEFEVPPIPIRQFRKQKNKAKSTMDNIHTTIKPKEILTIYEIWKFTINDQEEVFAIFSSKCQINRYSQPTWSDTKYLGFYGTVQEAINNITLYN